MLSDDPAVTAGGVEVKLLCHKVAETGRVQVGTRANDAVTRETTQLPGHIGENVHWGEKTRLARNLRLSTCANITRRHGFPYFTMTHHLLTLVHFLHTWVGHHQQDAVGAVLDDVGDDKLEDVDVALHQVEAALTLLLAGAGSNDHHLGVGCHTVVWKSGKTKTSLCYTKMKANVSTEQLFLYVLLSPLSATILCVLRKSDPCCRSMTSPFNLSSITSTRASSSHNS